MDKDNNIEIENRMRAHLKKLDQSMLNVVLGAGSFFVLVANMITPDMILKQYGYLGEENMKPIKDILIYCFEVFKPMVDDFKNRSKKEVKNGK
jgi:hypothetical protein